MGADLAGDRWLIDPILCEEMRVITDNRFDPPEFKEQFKKSGMAFRRLGMRTSSHAIYPAKARQAFSTARQNLG